ncbi:MAG: polysaccharide deacetylase family protein [Candidatus Thiosymbion ectosymbiont of Robbea hypermnestra]|nr:polysaccharide deacetylase family protein [Candidatus Thiosymbion ectosymbiont of Robbea hypermnestra]
MANRISILMYHQVGEFAPMRKHRANYCDHRRFAGQMAFLKDFGYRVLDLDCVLMCLQGKQVIPPRAVALTFDDGYVNFVRYALPVLQRHGFPATVYAVSGWVGRWARWLAKGPGRPVPALMSADQLRELRASGMVIGSHTVNHLKLAEATPNRQRRELTDSKAFLEDLLGEEVKHLCYPYGSFDLDVVRAAAANGYLSATTCLRGPAVPGDHPLVLPRKAISFGDNLVGYFWKLAVKNKPKPQLVEWRRANAQNFLSG